MASVRNASVILKRRPQGLSDVPQCTEVNTSGTIDIENVVLEKGTVLLKTLSLSIEPYVLGLMTGKIPYEPYHVGETIHAFGVAKVLRSSDENIKAGDYLEGTIDCSEYSISKSTTQPRLIGKLRLIRNPYNLPSSLFCGILGITGKTAYFGWMEHAKPEKGQTVFVTAGGGAVGSLVIQLAKVLHRDLGLKVIASAGSDEKVEYMKSIGADVAFNYKTQSTDEVLKKEGPIDIFWDSVGGETFDVALRNAAPYVRVIICGQVTTQTGDPGASVVKNLFQTIPTSASINGFRVLDPKLVAKWTPSFEEDIPRLIHEGKIKYREEGREGLQHVEQTLVDQLNGRIVGKPIIVVSED